MSKICTKCDTEKPLDDYYFRKDNGTHRNECKECFKSHRSRYRKSNPETVNASNRKSYAKNFRQRAGRKSSFSNKRTGNGTLTPSQVENLFVSHGFSCYYCQELSMRLTLDHVVPLSKGGSNDILNVVPACQHCNSVKKDRTEQEFLKCLEY